MIAMPQDQHLTAMGRQRDASPLPPPLWAQVALAMALLLVVLLPTAVKLHPDPYWASDPRLELAALEPAERAAAAERVHVGSLGPAGAIWLHVGAVAVAAGALAMWWWRGGRLCRWSVALAAAGAVPCLWHVMGDARHALLGIAWLGAVALALAVRHVACWPALRCWLVAAMVASLWPMAAHAGGWVLHEHPQLVAEYQQHREVYIEAHGWQEGSAAQQKFERRLMRNDALGAYGFSNVFGSVLVAITLLAAGLLYGLSGRARAGAMAVVAPTLLAGAVAAVLTRSRGALVAGAVAALLLVAWGWWRGARGRLTAPLLAVSTVAMALAGIILIGLLATARPDSPWLSMIFRFHYLLTSLRIFGEQPLLGTGPALYQDAFARLKPPDSPETVTSSHNVFIDYLAMLGLLGLAWAGLLLGWLWSAARGLAAPSRRDEDAAVGATMPGPKSGPLTIRGGDLLGAATIALLVQGMRAILEFDANWPFGAWLIGLVGFILVMTLLLSGGWLSGVGMRLGLLAAAVAVLMHNQIEMSFFQFASATMMWLIVAAACAAGAGPPRAPHPVEAGRGHRPRWRALAVPGATALAAVVLAVAVAVPVSRYQVALREAAVAWRLGDADAATAALARASAVQPTMPAPRRERAAIEREVAHALRAHPDRQAQAREWSQRAMRTLDEAIARSAATTSMHRQRAAMQAQRGRREADPSMLEAAAERLEALRPRIPHDPQLPLTLGDLYWELGDYDRARRRYRQALQISDDLWLDPADQLSAPHHERIENRLRHTPPAEERH